VRYLHLPSASIRHKFPSLVVLDPNRLGQTARDSAATQIGILLPRVSSRRVASSEISPPFLDRLISTIARTSSSIPRAWNQTS